jgi:hypothetical protein
MSLRVVKAPADAEHSAETEDYDADFWSVDDYGTHLFKNKPHGTGGDQVASFAKNYALEVKKLADAGEPTAPTDPANV